MAALESSIDQLYQRPLAEFTAARNALAKTLGKADAARVRTLPKPTLVPWAVNQVYWQARVDFDRLRAAGDRLRKAQIAALKGRSADLRGAAEAHKQATAGAVERALGLANAAGAAPGADELARTLEALSLAPELPETAGRFTRSVQPAGFEALAGVTPAAAPPATPRASEEAAKRREEDARRRAEAEIEKAEAASARAAAAETRAHLAWERAKHDAEDAERALARARARFTRARQA